ncbi:unnamed protein product, partial [Laminaria digitata]
IGGGVGCGGLNSTQVGTRLLSSLAGKESTTSIRDGVAVTVTPAPVVRNTKMSRRTPPASGVGMRAYGGVSSLQAPGAQKPSASPLP